MYLQPGKAEADPPANTLPYRLSKYIKNLSKLFVSIPSGVKGPHIPKQSPVILPKPLFSPKTTHAQI